VLPIVGRPEFGQRFQQPVPDAPRPGSGNGHRPSSTCRPFMHVSPGAANPQDMEHSIQVPAIVLPWP
jgi:hypothetical protein